MTDTLAIIISCSLVLYVAWRAERLDRTRPWFADPPKAPPQAASGPAWRRGAASPAPTRPRR